MSEREDDVARTRFMIIGLVRLVGAICVAVALLTVAGAIEWLPITAAYVLLVLGLVATFIIPTALVKRWRTPD